MSALPYRHLLFLMAVSYLLPAQCYADAVNAPAIMDVGEESLFKVLQLGRVNHPAIEQALASNNKSKLKLALRVLGNIGGELARAPLLQKLDHHDPEVRAYAAAMIALARLPAVEEQLISAWQVEDNEHAKLSMLLSLAQCGGDETQALLRDQLLFAESMTDRNKADQLLATLAQASDLLWRYRRKRLAILDRDLAMPLLRLSERSDFVAPLAAQAITNARRDSDAVPDYELQMAIKHALNERAKAWLVRALAPRMNDSADTAYLRSFVFDLTHQKNFIGWQAYQGYLAYLPQIDGAQLIRDVFKELDYPAAAHLLNPLTGRGKNLYPYVDALREIKTTDPDRQFLLTRLLDEYDNGVANIALVDIKIPGEIGQPLANPSSLNARQVQQERNQAMTVRPDLVEGIDPRIPRMYARDRLIIKTTHQELLIEMEPSTPYAGHYFRALAEQGFYNQLRFADLVPGAYVATGRLSTDPLQQDGRSWPAERDDIIIRKGDLAFYRTQNRKNSSLFFIALEDMPWLRGQFTIFAHLRNRSQRPLNTRDRAQTIQTFPNFVAGEKILSISPSHLRLNDLAKPAPANITSKPN